MIVEMSVTSPPAPADDQDHSGHPADGSYGRVVAWLAKRIELALAGVDLSPPQYRVMGLLAEGSSAASGLADRLAVARPSITAIVDGLVGRGLVDRRQEDADRRRVSLRLTEEGARVLAEADRTVDAHLEAIAGSLPAREEAAALRSLQLWGRALAASAVHRRQSDTGPPEGPPR